MLLLIALITSSTNGYDGSMMNGLQALTNWKNKVRLALLPTPCADPLTLLRPFPSVQ